MAKAPATLTFSGLNLVDVKKPVGTAAQSADPIKKFQGAVDTQLAFVEKEINNEPLPMTEGGRKPRLWYFNKSGRYYITVYYGNSPLNMMGSGKSTVEAGDGLGDVKKALGAIKEAADTDLRESIIEAAQAISARLTGTRGGRRKAS